MALVSRMPGVQGKKPVLFDVLGMAVTEIDHLPALRSGMEVPCGIIVMAIRWGGAADLAGVATGDIISEVDGKAARTLKELEASLAAHEPETPVRLLFRRVGTWRYLAIPLDEPCRAENTGACCS